MKHRYFLGLSLTISVILFLALAGCGIKARKEPLISEVEDYNVGKVYGWLKERQLPNGLVESAEGSNFVSLYENSLTAIVFSQYGDFERAERIFDFFNGRIESEFLDGPGGFGQFRDAQGEPTRGGPHRWLGDNAWLLIAINNYHHLADNDKYSRLKKELEDWIRSLQDERDGSLWGGFKIDGGRIGKTTEAIIDSFNAVDGYDDFHKEILQYLKNERWDQDKKIFLAWKEHRKYKYAMDLHSWGYCAFKDMPLGLIEEATSYITTKTATVNNREITGFCFDLDLDNVWLEGTAQMVVAYQTAGLDSQADYYIKELEKMIISSPTNPMLGGIPYVTNGGTHFAEGSLWEWADTNPNAASSTWYLLAKRGYDPMTLGRAKDIPDDDMFWLE